MFIHKNTDEFHSRYILAGSILVQPNVLHMNYRKLFFTFTFQTSLHLCYTDIMQMMFPYCTFKKAAWEKTNQDQSKKWRYMESYENVSMIAPPLPKKSVTLLWKKPKNPRLLWYKLHWLLFTILLLSRYLQILQLSLCSIFLGN